LKKISDEEIEKGRVNKELYEGKKVRKECFRPHPS